MDNNDDKDDNSTGDSQGIEKNQNETSGSEPNQDEDNKEKTPQKTLTEQQIQYLVDTAEKEAREKRQKMKDKLFEESGW